MPAKDKKSSSTLFLCYIAKNLFTVFIFTSTVQKITMRIQSINNNLISFQKQLMAQCTLKNECGEKEKCSIYELDPIEDTDYFMALEKESDWFRNELLLGINACLRRDLRPVYTLENNKGKCLGYICAPDAFEIRDGNVTYLENIETIPTQKFSSKKNRIKYIGETLMSFIVQKAKDTNKSAIYIYEYSKDAKPFYKENCGFKEAPAHSLRLDKTKFDKLISKNKEHSQLEILG